MEKTIDIIRFTNWITARGAEILPNTNEYELLRFRGKEVGVIYKSGKVSNDFTKNTISAFMTNGKWDGKPSRINPPLSADKKKLKKALLKRDGHNCFYCDNRLYSKELVLEEITLEHLISLSAGGTNHIGNLVLAHEKCNQDVDNMPLAEKVKIAINNRVHQQISRICADKILMQQRLAESLKLLKDQNNQNNKNHLITKLWNYLIPKMLKGR